MTNAIDGSLLSGLGLASRAPDSGAARSSDGPRSAAELGQADFLRLMIAQLRNQDPFKPMESGEFLGQIAQFGTVSGIDQVRSAVEQLAGGLGGNQALQAAGLVDRTVLVPSREAWLPPDGQVTGAADVPDGATSAAVGVYDVSGRLIATLPLESSESGRVPFVWDGTLADGGEAAPGFYELRPTALVGGKATSVDALVEGRVESVSLSGEGNASVALTVTGLGTVDLGRVRGIE
jgi:flagellar basal-body rod modification protein FlgD